MTAIHQITYIVDDGLSAIPYRDVVDAFLKNRIAPRHESRDWDYQANTVHPCWIVASHSATETLIAYCEFGFGPYSPWGLLDDGPDNRRMGMDCQWFSRLEDAIRASAMWTGEYPPGYEVQ